VQMIVQMLAQVIGTDPHSGKSTCELF
jgi:hypothetical protein